MRKVTEIVFRDCPPSVCNYYDKGPSAKRVIKSQVRGIYRRDELVREEFIVTHSYGKDYWRQDVWGDWKIHKTSNPDAVEKPVE